MRNIVKDFPNDIKLYFIALIFFYFGGVFLYDSVNNVYLLSKFDKTKNYEKATVTSSFRSERRMGFGTIKFKIENDSEIHSALVNMTFSSKSFPKVFWSIYVKSTEDGKFWIIKEYLEEMLVANIIKIILGFPSLFISVYYFLLIIQPKSLIGLIITPISILVVNITIFAILPNILIPSNTINSYTINGNWIAKDNDTIIRLELINDNFVFEENEKDNLSKISGNYKIIYDKNKTNEEIRFEVFESQENFNKFDISTILADKNQVLEFKYDKLNNYIITKENITFFNIDNITKISSDMEGMQWSIEDVLDYLTNILPGFSHIRMEWSSFKPFYVCVWRSSSFDIYLQESSIENETENYKKSFGNQTYSFSWGNFLFYSENNETDIDFIKMFFGE